MSSAQTAEGLDQIEAGSANLVGAEPVAVAVPQQRGVPPDRPMIAISEELAVRIAVDSSEMAIKDCSSATHRSNPGTRWRLNAPPRTGFAERDSEPNGSLEARLDSHSEPNRGCGPPEAAVRSRIADRAATAPGRATIIRRAGPNS
ncbi:MAG: hypothetical protein ACRDSL_18195 [Pseudonocardiaceae bacterium]